MRTISLPAVGGSTPPIPANFVLYTGEDVTLSWACQPAADLTGATLTGTVLHADGTTAFTFTPALVSATLGTFDVTWSRATTLTLSAGEYSWDVRRTDSNQNTVLACGRLVARASATS